MMPPSGLRKPLFRDRWKWGRLQKTLKLNPAWSTSNLYVFEEKLCMHELDQLLAVVNDPSFNDQDACIIILAIGSMGLLVGICYATIVDIQRRRATRRLHMELEKSIPRRPVRDWVDQIR
jgi:hypothetical protein